MNKKRKRKCQNQLEVARLFCLLCKHTEVRSKAGEEKTLMLLMSLFRDWTQTHEPTDSPDTWRPSARNIQLRFVKSERSWTRYAFHLKTSACLSPGLLMPLSHISPPATHAFCHTKFSSWLPSDVNSLILKQQSAGQKTGGIVPIMFWVGPILLWITRRRGNSRVRESEKHGTMIRYWQPFFR